MAEFTCIVCPVGCKITVEPVEDFLQTGLRISGYRCKRGREYAENEFKAPKRVLTSVVMVKGGRELLPVKTAAPIPKEKIFAAMTEIRQLQVKPGVKVGDIIKENLAQTGVSLVATKNIPDDEDYIPV
jgi:CxxC motif-containing protein